LGICFRKVSARLLLEVPIFQATISVVLIASSLYSLFPFFEVFRPTTALASVKFEQLLGQSVLSIRWRYTAA